MRMNRLWMLSSAFVVAVMVMTVLYASDNKKAVQPSIAKGQKELSSQPLSSREVGLIDKLNRSPEYSDLSAAQKVQIIVEQFRASNEKVRVDKREIARQKQTQINRGIRIIKGSEVQAQ